MSDPRLYTAGMAADPALDPAVMYDIAASRPDLHSALLANPALYPELRQWLDDYRRQKAADSRVVHGVSSIQTGTHSAGPVRARTSIFSEAASLEGPVHRSRKKKPQEESSGAKRALVALGVMVGIVGTIYLISLWNDRQDSTDESFVEPTSDTSETWMAEAEPTHVSGPTITHFVNASHIWSFSNQKGYSYNLRLAVGTPLGYSAESADAYGLIYQDGTEILIGSACDIDPETDGIIPLRRTATATTDGYDTVISTGFSLRMSPQEYGDDDTLPSEDDNRIRVESYFSNGPKCDWFSSDNRVGQGDSFFESISRSALSKSEEMISYSSIIIKDYFTPATPEGDTALLDAIMVTPVAAGLSSEPAEIFREADMESGTFSRTSVTLNGDLIE